MRTKIVFVLNILIIAGMIILLGYQFLFAEQKDWKLISKAAVLLIVYALGMLGVYRKRSPLDFTLYKEQYGFILGNAFTHDKAGYMQLMSAITMYNKNQYAKAVAKLDRLEEKCSDTDDYTAVYYFRALCKDESGSPDGAIADYEELLVRDCTHSHAWSNLGLLYMNSGRQEDALRAYKEAVSNDPKNQYAQTNLGGLYLRMGETDAALECVLKALEIDPKFYQAMGIAATAYKLMGDDKNAEKYCSMYGVNGGKSAVLREQLKNL